jgi:hypothetical protein
MATWSAHLTIPSYPQVQINGGQITLPSDLKGAIVHIGRARAGDIETLDIDYS